MFALIDCDNFFVSCERVRHPELRGVPVMVLSGGGGCVIARSNEVKAMGIGMGVPYFQVKELAERNKIIIFRSNHEYYGSVSQKVMKILREEAPAIEIYSIDEAFIDLRGLPKGFDLDGYMQTIIRRIEEEVGVPISIGIAPTKTLTKIASHRVKKGLDGSDKVYVMPNDRDVIDEKLKATPITEVWGVGRRYQVLLRKNNIESALDFVREPEAWVDRNMGLVGVRLWRELQGIASIEFDDIKHDKKQISNSRSFEHEIYDYDTLASMVANFITVCTNKLRAQKSAVGTLTVYLETSRFKSRGTYKNGLTHRFDTETDSLTELISKASEMLLSIYREGIAFKKAGVSFNNIVKKSSIQVSLLESDDKDKRENLMDAIDKINSKFGDNTVISARKG